jgi:hypothetical protein
MTISRKNKRRLRVDGESHLWWFTFDDPPHTGSLPLSVRMTSESGDFCVRYFLSQPDALRRLEVIGRRFRAIAGCGKAHRRCLCPSINEESVAPSGLSALIAWARESSAQADEIDGYGTPVHPQRVAAGERSR